MCAIDVDEDFQSNDNNKGVFYTARGSCHRIRENPVPIRLRICVESKITCVRCRIEISI